MKDRSFLYELRAYLIYAKVGEIKDGGLATSILPHFQQYMYFSHKQSIERKNEKLLQWDTTDSWGKFRL